MTNYGELAEKLNRQRFDAGMDRGPIATRGVDAARAYERVKHLVGREIDKANTELSKRRLATIERVFLPSYRGRLCLTFGADLLCTVVLEETKGQIKAVISGPPNATEISKKEFRIDSHANPEQITAEIVSGLLMGEFA